MDHLLGDIIQFFKKESKKSSDFEENLQVCLDILETLYPNAKPSGEDLLRIHQMGLKAIEEQPRQEEPSKTAEEFKNEGNEHLKAGNVEKAIECYERALQMEPRNHIFQANMGAAHYKAKNYEKATEYFQKAVEIEPTYGKAYRWWAVCLRAINDLNGAIDVLKRGVGATSGDDALVKQLESLEEEKRQKQQDESEEAPQSTGGGLNLGGLDLGGLLNNPGLMNMAQSFMQQPQFQQMMGSMLGNLGMQMPDFEKFESMPEVQESKTLKQFIAELKGAGLSGMPNVVMKWRTNEEVKEFLKKAGKDLVNGLDLSSLGSNLGSAFGGLFGGGRENGNGNGGQSASPSGYQGMFS